AVPTLIVAHRAIHSVPTRRSSDLGMAGRLRFRRMTGSIVPLPDVIEIEPLSLATEARIRVPGSKSITNRAMILAALGQGITTLRSEEHTSELQSRENLVCRLLLEK